jgi:D-alanyl-D-alanine carboxypeptidase
MQRHLRLVSGIVLLMLAPAAWAQDHSRRLQAAIDSFVASRPAVPGVVVTVRAPRRGIDWSGSAGLANREDNQPMTAAHAFRTASVTKLFTAAAVLRLAEDRSIELSSPIAAYVTPDTAALLRSDGYDPERITVGHLLTHTAGVYDYAGSDAFSEAVLTNPKHRWTRTEQLRIAVENGEPLSAPGEAYHYSDTGYLLLGELIECVTAKPLSQAVRQLLGFERLGLRSTYWEDGRDKPARKRPVATSYLGSLETSMFDPSLDVYGGGGLVSTSQDLAAFMRAAALGHIFRREGTLAAALSVPAAKRDPRDYVQTYMGLGMEIGGEQCLGHTGFWGTFVAHCPLSDTTYAGHLGLANAPEEIKSLLESLGRTAAPLADAK